MVLYLHDKLKPHLSTVPSLFDALMALSGECFRHQKGRTTQRIILGGKSYFIKQHRGVGWREIIKNLLQGKWPVLSAKQEWQAIQRCEQLGIAAAKVVGFGERGKNPAARQSFVLMEELAPVISLEALCANWLQVAPAFSFKRRLIDEVARIARLLHEHGMNHRDFYLCHFLLDLSPGLPSAMLKPMLYLLDLHRAEIREEVPERLRIKDLAGLYFSSKTIGLTRRDLYRFMKAYEQRPLKIILNTEKKRWQKVVSRGEKLYRDHTY